MVRAQFPNKGRRRNILALLTQIKIYLLSMYPWRRYGLTMRSSSAAQVLPSQGAFLCHNLFNKYVRTLQDSFYNHHLNFTRNPHPVIHAHSDNIGERKPGRHEENGERQGCRNGGFERTKIDSAFDLEVRISTGSD